MKRICILMSALVLATGAYAQTPNWKNLDVYSVNAETERTELVFWDNEKDALSSDFEKGQSYVSLNGTWKFRYADREGLLI